MITIELPFVVKSKSNNYRRGKGSFYKSKEMTDQEDEIRATTIQSLPSNHILFVKPVKVTVTVCYTDKRRRDLDGTFKGLFDCLNGLVWKDDTLVHEMHAYKILGAAKAATTITIEEI
jgi:Holliday junction resolvase RusA-like endonuclease